jgi:hypothetical protein
MANMSKSIPFPSITGLVFRESENEMKAVERDLISGAWKLWILMGSSFLDGTQTRTSDSHGKFMSDATIWYFTGKKRQVGPRYKL